MKSAIFAKTNSFIKHRLIELIGISLISVGLYLLISLVTYSPNDPNFIYRPENTEVKNFGGFYGSVISDFLFQSIGLVSFLITINSFIEEEISLKLFLENLLFTLNKLNNTTIIFTLPNSDINSDLIKNKILKFCNKKKILISLNL